MSIALWCLLAGALLPYLFTGLAKSRRDFDNRRPRAWLEQLEGWRRRAHWAQQNQFEAYPPFVAAVLTAELLEAPQGWTDALAVAWLALRLGYGACYVADWAGLRSLVWTAAMVCVAGLFVVAA